MQSALDDAILTRRRINMSSSRPSVSAQQGIRIALDDGARIVYRLSGTGTEGATLRVYLENHEIDPHLHPRDPQAALVSIIAAANGIAGIAKFVHRDAPGVII